MSVSSRLKIFAADDEDLSHMTPFQQRLHEDALNSDIYRVDIAKNHNTHPDTLDKLAGINNEIDWQIMHNQNTRGDTLHKFLLNDPHDHGTHLALSRNLNTLPHTLDLLADKPESRTQDRIESNTPERFRYNVAVHPNTTLNTLRKLGIKHKELIPAITKRLVSVKHKVYFQ